MGPVEIPIASLSEDILQNVIESFILREGTDYGRNEQSLESKLTQVRKQIENGRVKIIFDPESESVTLMNEQDWKKLISR